MVFFGLVACSDDDSAIIVTPESEKNIVELAQDDADLESLVAALLSAELVNTLQGEGPFTMLAPTNAAFQEFFDRKQF